jgi:protein transport protein SEC24
MYRVDDLSPKHTNINPLGYMELPKCIRLSIEAVSIDGAYLLSDTNSLILWLHRDVSQEFLQEAFGVMSLDQLTNKKPTTLSRLDTPLSRQLHAMVSNCHKVS